MGKKDWCYSDASDTQVGLMICTACRKKIESGEFRYRETEEAYLPQHRSCCADDPGWKAVDEATAAFERDRDRAMTDDEIDALKEDILEDASWDSRDLSRLCAQAKLSNVKKP